MNGTARMVLPGRHRIECIEQPKDVSRADTTDSERSTELPSACRWAAPFGGVVAVKSLSQASGCHPSSAAGKQIGQRCEVGHRRRLSAVERVLDARAPAAGFEIDEIWHIAGSDLEAERVAFDRCAVDELRCVHTEATVVISFT